MATYYADSTDGNDAWDGTVPVWTGALVGPKASLNGAEDIPVAAGDVVHVRSGVYRETLTVDVSGGVGNPITYIGDVTGQIWAPGGIVRITGSDNDQTNTRTNGVYGSAKSYRTFRGFRVDGCDRCFRVDNGAINWTVQECTGLASAAFWYSAHNTDTDLTIQNCFAMSLSSTLVANTANDDTSCIIDNCTIIGGNAQIQWKLGDTLISNCTLLGGYRGVFADTSGTGAGQLVTVNNCIVAFQQNGGLVAAALGELVEDYNALFNNTTDRLNVNVGGNSVSYLSLLELPLLYDGVRLPWQFGALSEWSQIARITDSGTGPTDDFYGITRPVTNGKRSWGAVQYRPTERDTATTYDASDASLSLPDAGAVQFKVPVSAVSTTISVQVYREANYAGVNPQMIVKQPGQADDTTTDAGASGGWNELTTTLTPAADPEWVMVELRSNNTAAAGNYAVYFDQLTPTPTGVLGDFDHWVSNRETVGDAIQQSGGGGGAARGIIIRG